MPSEMLFKTNTKSNINQASEHRRGGSGSAAPAADLCSSPHVIRATDHKITITDDQSITIDWMRWSGTMTRFKHVFVLLEEIFGIKENEFTDKKGIYFYENMLEHPSGLKVIYTRDGMGRNSESMVVEMSGSVIQHFGLRDSLKFNHYLYHSGFKFTRCDVALDTVGENISIIDEVTQACDTGYMCKTRSYEPKISVSSDMLTAHGVNLGSRSSSIYYRFYDKGLEQDQGLKSSQRKYEVGEWIRMELEIKQERAVEFGLIVARHESPTDEAIVEACKNVLFGHVDFRSGDKNLSLNDRKRCVFWSEFIGTAKNIDRIKISRTKTTADSHMKWMKTAVIPCLLSIEEKLKLPINRIVEIMSRGCVPYFDLHARPVIYDYHQKYLKGELDFVDGVDDIKQSIQYEQLVDDCLNYKVESDLHDVVYYNENYDYIKRSILNVDFNSYE